MGGLTGSSIIYVISFSHRLHGLIVAVRVRGSVLGGIASANPRRPLTKATLLKLEDPEPSSLRSGSARQQVTRGAEHSPVLDRAHPAPHQANQARFSIYEFG